MSTGAWIKMARQAAGLSQRALAERVGVSAMAISKYERDLDMPSSGVMLRLADVLGVAPSFLFGRHEFVVHSVQYRRHRALSARAEDRLTASVQGWLNRYMDAEASAGQVAAFAYPAGFPRVVAALDDAERAAECLRSAWDLGSDAIGNLLEVLERHGIKTGLVDGPDGFDAMALFADDQPVIVVRRDVPGDRQRFSVAHELGHLMLRTGDGMDPEKAANRFAAAFLVPASAARAELGPARRSDLDEVELHLLKRKYGLSMRAWYLRACELGLISEATARRLQGYFKSRGWDRTEPGEPLAPEVPGRLERLVRHALAEETITTSRAAELLDLGLSEFRTREAVELAAVS